LNDFLLRMAPKFNKNVQMASHCAIIRVMGRFPSMSNLF
jgi:hypothetical protein